MSKLLQYMQVICIGQMAGVLVLSLGALDTLACAVAVIVTVLLSRLIEKED